MPNDTKNSVMLRVRMVYAIRRTLKALSMKLGLFVIFSSILTWSVSFINIIRNFLLALKDFGALYNFIVQAFVGAGYFVQTLILGIVAIFVFVLRDFYRIFMFSRGDSEANNSN